MDKPDASLIEKSAVAVSFGSLMLLTLLLIGDAISKSGSVFLFLGTYAGTAAWGFAAAVPALTIAYMLGIMTMAISELIHTLSHRFRNKIRKGQTAGRQYLFKEEVVFELARDNDMLLKRLQDIIRYRGIVRSSWFPLLVLGVGLCWELFAGHHQELNGLLILSVGFSSLLAVLCLPVLKFLDNQISDIWDVALVGFQPNVLLSIECDRTHLDANCDWLTIKAKLTKGDRGVVFLHDVQARIYHPKSDEAGWIPHGAPIHFTDVFCKEFEIKALETKELDCKEATPRKRGTILTDDRSQSRQLLTLVPGDSIEMSETCKVRSETMCKVEVVVLSVHCWRDGSGSGPEDHFSQWRTSQVVQALHASYQPQADDVA
jgi:hypothetical protein